MIQYKINRLVFIVSILCAAISSGFGIFKAFMDYYGIAKGYIKPNNEGLTKDGWISYGVCCTVLLVAIVVSFVMNRRKEKTLYTVVHNKVLISDYCFRSFTETIRHKKEEEQLKRIKAIDSGDENAPEVYSLPEKPIKNFEE